MKYLIILLFIWTTHAYNFSKNCGVSTTLGTAGCTPVKGEKRAIVPPGQMPWHVQVNITHKGVSKLLCSGVLITMKHILTAAQCLTVNNTIRPNDKIKIRAGSSLLNEGQFIKPKKISIHPNFTQILPLYIDTPLYEVDLAVVELEYEFKSSLNITPICLPLHENIIKDKDLVIVSGWTTTFDEDNLGGDYFSPGYFFKVHNNLRREALRVIARNATLCKFSYSNGTITPGEDFFCAVNTHIDPYMDLYQGSEDPCTGEMGGPVTKEKDGKCYLAGTATKEYGCEAALAVNIHNELKWIKHVMDM